LNSVERLGRAFELYRRTATSRSAIALLIANAIPLIGVLFYGWSLWMILVLYWLENGIVGLWNLPRILLAQGSVVPGKVAPFTLLSGPGATVGSLPVAGRVGLAIFFAIHYGIFWAVHGVFVFALPGFMRLGEPTSPFGAIDWPWVALAAAGLVISHGASFFFNFVGRREYLDASPIRRMGAVYGRVVVLHLTILLGAFAIALIGAPIGALIVMVVLKMGFDLRLHLREHRSPG
jgi:hypothetical protein